MFQVTTVRAFHFVVNPPVPGDIYLGYLPLAHILELLSEFTMIVQGIPVGYSSPNTMIDKSTKVRTILHVHFEPIWASLIYLRLFETSEGLVILAYILHRHTS